MELGGAELLGRDVAAVCGTASNQIRTLLTSERHRERLVNHMERSAPYREATPAAEEMVEVFCRGFLNGR
jgi:hypothetical protein